MINLNGSFYTDLSQIPIAFNSSFLNPFHIKEIIRFEEGKLLFWELHYFRLMAAMRRMRYLIPNTFTMDYLQKEIESTIDKNQDLSNAALVSFNLLEHKTAHQNDGNKVLFVIETEPTSTLKSSDKNTRFLIDLYKDAFVLSGLLSNLTLINAPLRKMIGVYAFENGLDDCLILNEQKNLVETTLGTPYLINDNVWITPDLISGCQNLIFRNAFNKWLKNENSGLLLEERNITPFELQRAEEIMIVSVESGGVSVSNYRKTSFQNTKGQAVFNTFITSSLT